MAAGVISTPNNSLNWLAGLYRALQAAVSARFGAVIAPPVTNGQHRGLDSPRPRSPDIIEQGGKQLKRLILERKPTTPTHTEGFLTLSGVGICATIERPYIDDGSPGGKPFASCVPSGVFDLIPHTRGDGAKVVALVNPALGVHYLDDDRPAEGGRYLILIHVGNWAHDVVGCIAPGLYHADNSQGRMVSSSKKAMRRIMDFINEGEAQIEIRWI